MSDVVRVADQDARDRIVHGVERSMLVAAGAGSGKTTALVERLVNLVAGPDPARRVPMRQIAAITFTEKAAAELTDRLRRRLRRQAASDPSVTEVLAALDHAAIQTLHGFARRLVALDPLTAGVPPGFRVADQVRANLRRSAWWERTLERLLARADLADAWTLCLEAEVPLERLRQIADRMAENPDRNRDSWDASEPEWDGVDRIVAEIDGAVDGADPKKRESDAFVEAWREWSARWHAIDRNSATLGQWREAMGMPAIAINRGSKTIYPDGFDRNGAVKSLRRAKARLAATLGVGTVDPLLREIRRAVDEDFAARCGAGEVEFADLLVLARNLLRDPNFRRKARARFTHLLVDEFQDTDPIQLEIVRQIATTHDEVVRFAEGLPDAFPEGGGLFFVGDAQQSIYRFRRAEVRLFSATADRMPNVERLTVNFRSAAPILDFVNAVFRPLLPGFQALDASPGGAAVEGARVVAIGHELEPGETNRPQEPAAVADAVVRILEEGWPVRDGGATRPCRADDIAILYPTRTSVAELERQLADRGVAYRVESQSPLFQQEEVRQVLAVLRAVADPEDAVALVAALRSPLFGLHDGDLEAHAAAGGAWRAQEPGGEPGSAVAEACAKIAAWQSEVGGLTASEWLARVLREGSAWAAADAERRPRDAWQRWRRLADHARRFEASTRGSLRAFLDYCDDQAEESAAEVERIAPEDDDASVRLMTVHAAKGMEFPIVVAMGFGGKAKSPAAPYVGFDAEGVAHLGLTRLIPVDDKDFRETFPYLTTSRVNGWRQGEVEADLEERLRWAYVALTRARDHLVAALHHQAPMTDVFGVSTAASLAKALKEHAVDVEVWPSTDPAGPRIWRSDAARPADEPGMDREAWEAWRKQALARAPRWRSVAATTLAHDAESAGVRLDVPPAAEPGEDDLRWEADEPGLEPDDAGGTPAPRRGRKGAHLGRAIHTALQTLDPDRPMTWDSVVRAQCEAEGIPEETETALRMVQRAATSPAVARAWAGAHWREAYLAKRVGDRVVEGYLDLLAERADGRFEVVDYKTDEDVSPAGIEASMAHYRVQGGAYALLVEETLGVEVAAVTFVFLNSSPAEERVVEDLPDWIETVRASVAAPTKDQ